jgi:hypothetical protein
MDPFTLQRQMRQNNEELQSYIDELQVRCTDDIVHLQRPSHTNPVQSWESEITSKDKDLVDGKLQLTKTVGCTFSNFFGFGTIMFPSLYRLQHPFVDLLLRMQKLRQNLLWYVAVAIMNL